MKNLYQDLYPLLSTLLFLVKYLLIILLIKKDLLLIIQKLKKTFFMNFGKLTFFKVLQSSFVIIFLLGMIYGSWTEILTKGGIANYTMTTATVIVLILTGSMLVKSSTKVQLLICVLLLPLGNLSAQEAQEKEKTEFVLGFMNTPEIAKYEKVEAGLYIRPMIARFGEKTNQILLYSLKEKSVEFAFDVKLPHRMLVTCFLSKNVQKDYENKHHTNPSYLSFGLEKSLFTLEKEKVIWADVSFFIEGRKHFDDKKIIPVVGINMIHGFKINGFKIKRKKSPLTSVIKGIFYCLTV